MPLTNQTNDCVILDLQALGVIGVSPTFDMADKYAQIGISGRRSDTYIRQDQRQDTFLSGFTGISCCSVTYIQHDQ